MKKAIQISIPLIIILFIILLKILPFGYYIDHLRYEHTANKIINLCKPKFSFSTKIKEDNFYYKNIRGKSILRNEIKNYLNTLEHLKCNTTKYYYDESADITIIDYNIKENILYSTINYNIKNGNYCNKLELIENDRKINFGQEKTLNNDKSNLSITFIPSGIYDKFENQYTASLKITYKYNSKNDNYRLEESTGTFEIKDDKLIYTRTDIFFKDHSITIPDISTFTIKDNQLILEENYLSKYENSIIIK